MLHTIGIILIPAGAALIIASAIIFFMTDCKEAFKDLRTTNTIMPESENAPAISDLYYDTHAQDRKEKRATPTFKRSDESGSLYDKEPKAHARTPSFSRVETAPLDDAAMPKEQSGTLFSEGPSASARETAPLNLKDNPYMKVGRDTAPLTDEDLNKSKPQKRER